MPNQTTVVVNEVEKSKLLASIGCMNVAYVLVYMLMVQMLQYNVYV
jgi:hypothetical protein